MPKKWELLAMSPNNGSKQEAQNITLYEARHNENCAHNKPPKALFHKLYLQGRA